MAFRKYAHAITVEPTSSIQMWQNFRTASKTPVSTNVSSKHASLILKDFSPEQYLLTHATIVASVDTEDAPPHVRTGNLIEEGQKINRPFRDFRVTAQTDKFFNGNMDAFERKLLLNAYMSFIGAENYCVTPESLIETKNGRIPIKDLRVGDQVYTGKGRLRPVLHVNSRFYQDTLCTVKYAGGGSLRATLGHKVYTSEGYVTVENLTPGQSLKVPRNREEGQEWLGFCEEAYYAFLRTRASLSGQDIKLFFAADEDPQIILDVIQTLSLDRDWECILTLQKDHVLWVNGKRLVGLQEWQPLDLQASHGFFEEKTPLCDWLSYEVEAVERGSYEGLVYNLDVAQDHSYIADHILVRNCEHVQIPELSKGKILDAVARDLGDTVYIDILVATDKRHTDLIADIMSQKLSTMSMGAIIKFSLCSKCGNYAVDETDLCTHIRYQKGTTFISETGEELRVGELCGHHSEPDSLHFIEASWVETPAFEGAVTRTILNPHLLDADQREAIEQSLQEIMPKEATVWDFASFFKTASPMFKQEAEKLMLQKLQSDLKLQESNSLSRKAFFGGDEEKDEGEEPTEEESTKDFLEDLVSETSAIVKQEAKQRVLDQVRSETEKAKVPNSSIHDSNESMVRSSLQPTEASLRRLVLLHSRDKNASKHKRVYMLLSKVSHEHQAPLIRVASKMTPEEVRFLKLAVQFMRQGGKKDN